MDRTLLYPLLLLFMLPNSALSQEAPSIARWDRAVCLFTEARKTDGQHVYATAFLVERPDSMFLVTGAHVAQDTHGGTRILYRNASGASKFVQLGLLTDKAADPWRAHQNSDLSVMTVAGRPVVKEAVKELKMLAIDFECLLTDVPKRTTEIDLVGFPISLGVRPAVSPLAMKGHLASREMQAEAKWGTEPMLYAIPAVGAGCSGGPVFQSTADREEVKVVGMYVGVMFDPTGAKLSKIVPARVVRAAIERMTETQSSPQDGSKQQPVAHGVAGGAGTKAWLVRGGLTNEDVMW